MTDVNELFQTMDYGPAPEQSDYVHAWLAQNKKGFGLFINGEWTEPKTSTETIETRNPANGNLLGSITAAGADDIDAAVAAAKTAFPGWSGSAGHVRAKYLYALAYKRTVGFWQYWKLWTTANRFGNRVISMCP
jgi:aldehyde dehydrogenase (NAD+)